MPATLTGAFKRGARRPFRSIANRLEIEQQKFVRQNHQKRLEQIVAPFSTPYEFKTITGNVSGNSVAIVVPINKTVQRRAGVPTSGTIDAYDLFFYLNDGTEKRHARMPANYINASFPNSVNTRNVTNDRAQIFVDKRKINEPGLEPRDWLNLVALEFSDSYRLRIVNTLRRGVSRISGV